jgi:hypothetical protein
MSVNKFLTRDHVDSYLREHPCIDCGEKDILVLDFDHVRDIKLKSISAMLRQGATLDQIKLEIAKCDVRCANCHRRRHRFEERGLEE